MSRERSKGKGSILCGICPDKRCRSKLYFPNFDTSIECTHCGQRHERTALQSVQEVSDLDARLNNMIRNILMSNIIPKRGTETVKVLGLSNYHCKLLSPLLTKYGMDKRTGKARLLTDMNQGDIFDCSLFGDRAFLIDPEHIPVPGFGRDVTGSMSYLSHTLDLIKRVNDDEERLIPVHADGDGHCLVHAISRALVGRELFWHPLRCSLKKHFEDNLEPYKELFKDFVDEGDWRYIIDECDPDFVPPDGELLGLRNIHVFGLANVLKRPIILLDSLECMNSLGDYAALFLPSLIPPELCRGKNNRLNKPLCIAWSSPGHNHYIPLVGIKKKPLPVLPVSLLPKAWGVPQSQILTYMELEEGKYCTIGGDRNLGDPYILRLVSAMEELFLEKFGVHPSLVADVHHYLFQSTGVVSADRDMVIQSTKKSVSEGRLYRCLNCDAVCEQVIKPQWFRPGGVLYNMAVLQYGKFVTNQLYPFPLHGIVCRYNSQRNELEPDLTRSCLESCTWCNGNSTLRKVKADGSIMYRNDDKTKTPSNSSICGCGFKHYWGGKEYDNPPQKLTVTLEWNNQLLKDTVMWFEKESDPTLNSNVYQVASEVVQKHFPGEFGSERLVQRVVEQLLNQTKPSRTTAVDSEMVEPDDDMVSTMPSNKIIMAGTGVLHKEELGMNEKERQLLQKIQENAEAQQRRSLMKVIEKADATVTTAIPDGSEGNEKESTKADALMDIDAVQLHVEQSHPDKFARVVTSDGRQEKLVLESDGVSYDMLQSWINEKFQIPPKCQRIKYGFPPQELQPPADGKALHLSHGDRVIVEMIPDPDRPQPSSFATGTWPSSENQRETSFSSSTKSVTDQWMQIIDSLKANNTMEMESLFLSMTASLSNQLVWNYAKKMPHLFKRGGVFYMQVDNDIGLRDKKHCNLKTFPNKTFCYNAQSDALELCVEPYGHFSIDEDIDMKIKNAYRTYSGCVSSTCHSPLSSKLISNYGMQSLSDSKVVQIEQESCEQSLRDVSMDADEKVPLLTRNLVRKGPGYSVLSALESSPEVQVDKLQTLANQLTGGSKKADECTVTDTDVEKKQKGNLTVVTDNSVSTFCTKDSDLSNRPVSETVSEGSDKSNSLGDFVCADTVKIANTPDAPNPSVTSEPSTDPGDNVKMHMDSMK